MPRPKKERRCVGGCSGRAFKPTGIPLIELSQIELGRDELEALRLCDMQGLFQEAAGEQMGVSRGTVQRLLAAARRKVATALVEGAALILSDEDATSAVRILGKQPLPLTPEDEQPQA